MARESRRGRGRGRTLIVIPPSILAGSSSNYVRSGGSILSISFFFCWGLSCATSQLPSAPSRLPKLACTKLWSRPEYIRHKVRHIASVILSRGMPSMAVVIGGYPVNVDILSIYHTVSCTIWPAAHRTPPSIMPTICLITWTRL